MGLRTAAPQALLLARSTPGRGPPAELAGLAAAVRGGRRGEVVDRPTDAVEAAELLRARRLAHPAMEKLATTPTSTAG